MINLKPKSVEWIKLKNLKSTWNFFFFYTFRSHPQLNCCLLNNTCNQKTHTFYIEIHLDFSSLLLHGISVYFWLVLSHLTEKLNLLIQFHSSVCLRWSCAVWTQTESKFWVLTFLSQSFCRFCGGRRRRRCCSPLSLHCWWTDFLSEPHPQQIHHQ